MIGHSQLKHLGTANDDLTIAPEGELRGIYIGTLLATAVVTVYEGTTTSGRVLMTIDAGARDQFVFNPPVRATSKSIYIKLTTANAKVTIAYA
jgi:hypothetical protein